MLNNDNTSLQDIWQSAFNTVFDRRARYQQELIDAVGDGCFEIHRRVFVEMSEYQFFHLSMESYIEPPVDAEGLAFAMTECFIEERGQQPAWLISGYTWGWRWDARNHIFKRGTRRGSVVVLD